MSMKFERKELCRRTTQPVEVIDITAAVADLVEESAVRNGLLTLISNHTTAFVNLNEHEPHLRRDMVDFLTSVAPQGKGYRHDKHPVDDRANAHAHLAGLFMSGSLSVPVVQGRVLLGPWQAILLIELDGPRDMRRINVHIMGEC
jgi:secondary thiamine-phosphate synthase enzyme